MAAVISAGPKVSFPALSLDELSKSGRKASLGNQMDSVWLPWQNSGG